MAGGGICQRLLVQAAYFGSFVNRQQSTGLALVDGPLLGSLSETVVTDKKGEGGGIDYDPTGGTRNERYRSSSLSY